MERLFVYGSLQPGESNEHVLAELSGEWQPAVIKGTLHEAGWGTDMGYPGLVLDDNGSDVQGYVLTSADLANHWVALDKFEGDEYERVAATVIVKDGERTGERVEAYVYVIRQWEMPS